MPLWYHMGKDGTMFVSELARLFSAFADATAEWG